MPWTLPRTWVTDELVTAAIMNTHVRDNFNSVWRLIAYKTADETVTSSIVLQSDDHLTFSIGASEAWAFELVLMTTGPGFLKGAFNAPAGAAGWWAAEWGSTTRKGTPSAAATYVDGETFSTDVDPTGVTVNGYVLNSATPGTFVFRWCQSGSNGTGTVVKKGSHLLGMKLA